jgi:catechol 2,3-dioxygenase-like lactoylglutathione lyase family enzyme
MKNTFARFSRRELFPLAGACATALITGATGRGEGLASPLPIHTSGLEHIGFTVPQPEVSARFYGMLFDPQLFQEKDPPPRFYARMGTAYIAFGGSANVTAKIDHICALVKDYKPAEVRAALAAAGITMGASPISMPTDGDGLRLQLLGVPGGLAKTIIPNTRITQDDPVLEAIGLDHVVLLVSNVEKSLPFYRTFFGMELPRARKEQRVWFQVANTRLGLEQAAGGQTPKVDHFCLRVAAFHRPTAAEKLTKLGAKIMPSNEERLLRFQDLNGFTVELKAPAKS